MVSFSIVCVCPEGQDLPVKGCVQAVGGGPRDGLEIDRWNPSARVM